MVIILRVLLAAILASAVLLGSAPNAHACVQAAEYQIEPELLVGDFNDPASQLNDDYRAWLSRNQSTDDDQRIEILGAYVYESVYWVDESGDFTSGSVNALVEVWGQWPEDRTPQVIPVVDRSELACPREPASPVGGRLYVLVTSDGTLNFGTGDDLMPVLTAAFGAPDVAVRDFDLEAQFIAQLQDVDTGSGLPLVLGGVGVVALLGAGLFWKSTRRPAPAAH